MKRSFFQAAVISILLYGCTTWTLRKRLEKKLDGNYTRRLRAIMNKSWRQHPQDTNCTATCLLSRKLSKLDEPDVHGPPHMAVLKQGDQHEHTFSSYVRIRDVVLKTCLGRWMIGRSSERRSGIAVLPARHDDDDVIWR